MLIYTTGYSGKNHAELLPMLERLNAILVDIRLVPRSRWQPHWNKGALAVHLGERYRHVGELGNKKFKERRIEIADLDAGLAIVEALATEKSIVLMCGCSDARFCHRRTVAEALSKRGHSVPEISKWSLPTPTLPFEA